MGATAEQVTEQVEDQTTETQETTSTTEPTEKPSSQDASILASEESTEDTQSKAPADWPENWRDLAAGESEEIKKRLERYASPKAAMEALIAAQNRISKGELQKTLGENPSEEELQEWREANGVPQEPSGYEIQLEEGRVIGEADKPMVDKFLERMHSKNATPDTVNEALNAYYEIQDENVRQQEEMDRKNREEVTDALYAEYGENFRRNINKVRALLSQGGEETMNKIMGARVPTEDNPHGRPLGDDPDIIRYLVNLANEANPSASVVPAGTSDPSGAISDEIADIQKKMRQDYEGYFKDDKLQKRYQELLQAQEKMSKRK